MFPKSHLVKSALQNANVLGRCFRIPYRIRQFQSLRSRLHTAFNIHSDIPNSSNEPISSKSSDETKIISHLSIDSDEAIKFKKFANHWWDLNGELSGLHSMNSLRVPFIRNGLCPTTLQDKTISDTKHQVFAPLSGLKILDVGCGGGILCEPLARLGAHVLGIDEVPESIAVAKQHADLVNYIWNDSFRKPEYQVVNLTTLSIEFPNYFDAVVASEVLEHVSDWEEMIRTIGICLKPGGMMFTTTLNQTMTSLMLAIVGAEYVARIVPVGTHQWNKFIEPSKLQAAAIRHGFQPRQLIGMCLNPLTNRWSWTSNLSVNYAMSAVKLSP